MSNPKQKIRVLFVCMGNICRSPLAEGIFQDLLVRLDLDEQFNVDSAGTSNYHVGEQPDERAQRVALNYGVELNHNARQFTATDFANFDYILVMDHLNYDTVLGYPEAKQHHEKVFLFRTFDESSPDFYDVPDPYYGGAADFEEVADIVLRASRGFLQFLQQQEKLY